MVFIWEYAVLAIVNKHEARASITAFQRSSDPICICGGRIRKCLPRDGKERVGIQIMRKMADSEHRGSIIESFFEG